MGPIQETQRDLYDPACGALNANCIGIPIQLVDPPSGWTTRCARGIRQSDRSSSIQGRGGTDHASDSASRVPELEGEKRRYSQGTNSLPKGIGRRDDLKKGEQRESPLQISSERRLSRRPGDPALASSPLAGASLQGQEPIGHHIARPDFALTHHRAYPSWGVRPYENGR
ncbi:hypothetical protein NMY22_g8171 [Coprinellus aureogranulatus]|nr:hypothetical protein NMY22_g8171 [Coprinellus aureogranulatus]